MKSIAGGIKDIGFKGAALIVIETLAVAADAALAFSSFVLAVDSYTVAGVFAILSAIVIFMAGEYGGKAMFKKDYLILAVSLACGLGSIVGVAAVRSMFGTGGPSQGTGVAAALAASGDGDGKLLVAVVVAVLMLGILLLCTKASHERCVEAVARLKREIAVVDDQLFDLEKENELLDEAYEAEAKYVSAKAKRVTDYIIAEAIAMIESDGTIIDDVIDAVEEAEREMGSEFDDAESTAAA